MTIRKIKLRHAAASLAFAAGAAAAQVESEAAIAEQAETAVPAEADCCVIPALQTIELEIADKVTSRDNRAGDTFDPLG